MSTYDLTQTPPGVNPFLYYQDLFHRRIVLPSLTGSRTRFWVLLGLLIYVTFIAVFFLVLHFITTRRRGDSFWVYRLVERDKTKYIVGNPSIMGPLGMCLLSVPLLGTMVSVIRLVPHTDLDNFRHYRTAIAYAWRTSFWPLYLAVIWAMTAANLQAFCLAGGINRRVVSAKVANAMFISVLLIGVSILASLAGVGSRNARGRVTSYIALDAFLTEQAPLWNGTLSSDAIAEFSRLADSLIVATRRYEYLFVRLVAVFAAAPPFLLLVNLTSLALIFKIREQIRSNETLIFRQSISLSAIAPPTPRRPSAETSSAGDEEGGLGDRQKRLVSIHRFLIVSYCLHTVMVTLLAVAAIWSAVLINKSRKLSAPEYEALLTLPVWIVTCPSVLSITYKVVTAIQEMPRARSASSPLGSTEKDTRNGWTSGGATPSTPRV